MKIISFAVLCIIFCLSFNCGGQTFTGLPPGFNSGVRSLYFDSTTNYLYAGGNFWKLADGTDMSYISRWDGTNWDSLGAGVNSNVYSIVRYNGEIYAGGNFLGSGNMVSKALAKWDGNMWQPFGNINSVLPGAVVWHLNVINNELYVLGSYDSIAGLPATGMAKFNGQFWTVLPYLDSLGIFGTIAEFNGELYVGGNFDSGNGIRDIAKFDGTNWVSVGGGFSGANTLVDDMKIFQNKLYVAGLFEIASGDPGNNIAIWDGISWSQPANGLLPTNVHKIFEFNSELYAGGAILSASGVPVNYLAKWNGINWLHPGVDFDNRVLCFASNNNDLYLGGGFKTANNDSIYGIVRYHFNVGLNSIEPLEVFVGPNPAYDKLHINCKQLGGPVTLKISDITGRICHQTSNILMEKFTINVSNYQDGVYFIQVECAKSFTYRKVIKISNL